MHSARKAVSCVSFFRVFSCLSLLGVLGGSPACGSPPPAAPPPAPSAKPVAAEKAPAPADLSAVPRPESLVLFARLSKPEQALKLVGTWSKLPMPGAEVLTELLTGASAGKVVDLSQPIDVAIAMAGDGRNPNPLIAVSAAVRSLEEAKGAFSEHYKLAPGANGATRILGLGDPQNDEERPCDLAPSAGAASTRLICGDSPAAIEALEAWLARSAPREAFPQDVHVDMRVAALRPIVQSFRGMLPIILASALDARGGPAALGQAAEAAVGDVADLANDLEQLTLDVNLSDPGADATLTASFTGTTAVLTRLAIAHPERADVPPAAFWHLPADADVAYYTRGVDAKEILRTRELGQAILIAALEKQGIVESDAKAITEPVMRYVDLYTGPMVYAKGIDMTALDKADGALGQAKEAARVDAEHALLQQLAGWSIAQTSEPAPKVSQIAKDLAAALARPGLAKWAKSALNGAPAPSAKIAPLPANAQLPQGTTHLEITAWDALPGAPVPMTPPPVARPKTGPGAPPPPPPPAAHAAPPKPRTIHVIIVPDAGKSWIVLAASQELAIAKARAVLPNAPDAGTLGKRGELDALRDARASSGGFVSARGILSPTPFRYMLGTAKLPRGPLLDGLASTPARGATPITFTTRAEPKGLAGALVVTGKVPRGAIEDITKLALKKM